MNDKLSRQNCVLYVCGIVPVAWLALLAAPLLEGGLGTLLKGFGFDETEIVMNTSLGVLVVTGDSLHIGKLSLDGGELHVDGRIDAIAFEDAPSSRGGLLSRLFGG